MKFIYPIRQLLYIAWGLLIITHTNAANKIKSPATITAIAADSEWVWIGKDDGSITHIDPSGNLVRWDNELDTYPVKALDENDNCLVALHEDGKVYRVCKHDSAWDRQWKLITKG